MPDARANRSSRPEFPETGAGAASREVGAEPGGEHARPGAAGLDPLPEIPRIRPEEPAANTRKAYASDWAAFGRWCRFRGENPLPPDPRLIALYLAECAESSGNAAPLSLASIERRLAGLSWAYRQRGLELDRADPHLAGALAGIRREHRAPPMRKAPVSAAEILAMVGTLSYDLRGLRDRALLLLGFAAGIRRSELVGLDRARSESRGAGGWVEIEEAGALLVLRGKAGWREIEVGRGSSDRSCPVRALETWLDYARIDSGPVFRRVSRDGKRVLDARLSDRHVVRLIKRAVLAAGLRPDLPEAERLLLYAGHSLRTGLASHAGIGEDRTRGRAIPASAGMASGHRRREDRFRVNITRAAGL